eukprot:XP_020406489.1 CMP-sialic acid transporter 2 [Zea mays]
MAAGFWWALPKFSTFGFVVFRLITSFDEVRVYPIPVMLYLVKNLLQYYIFEYVDAPAYQILKNLNIISTGVLYRIILKKKSDHVLQTPIRGWVMAIVMALLSGFAGVYTEVIIKKNPSRNINAQNFWLYIFGMLFNLVAICVQDFDAVMNKSIRFEDKLYYSYLKRLFCDLFICEGYQLDYVFDWTIMKYP